MKSNHSFSASSSGCTSLSFLIMEKYFPVTVSHAPASVTNALTSVSTATVFKATATASVATATVFKATATASVANVSFNVKYYKSI